MLKSFEQLTEDQKEEAMRRWPDEYETLVYLTRGVEIAFAAR